MRIFVCMEGKITKEKIQNKENQMLIYLSEIFFVITFFYLHLNFKLKSSRNFWFSSYLKREILYTFFYIFNRVSLLSKQKQQN